MKRKKVIVGLAIGITLTVLVVALSWSSKRVDDKAVEVSLVGYTNVNGTSMALFKLQNNKTRRMWLRHVDYLLGESFRQPPGAWQCPSLAGSNRWNNPDCESIPPQFVPLEPTHTSPDPTNLMVPVPTNRTPWRIGVLVEFDISLWEKIGTAWRAREVRLLNPRQFINNSTEAIWIESPVLTNAMSQAHRAATGD